MRIAAIQYTGVAGPYVVADLAMAFRGLGHEVFTVNAQDILALSNQYSTHAIVEACRATFKDCDFVYGYGAVPCVSVELNGKETIIFEELGIPYLSIYYDAPTHPQVLGIEMMAYDSTIHHRFIWDEYYTRDMESMGFANVHYMPIGTAYDRYSPCAGGPDCDKWMCDVSFVGNWSPRRDLVMGMLIDHAPAIYGINWDKYASPELKRCFHFKVDNVTELPHVYAHSKININVTMEQGISSVNMRVFDCIASGGFVLTDYKPELEKLFVLDKEVICYYNVKQIPELVKHYLEHEDERMAIVAAGRERILKDHTYASRAAFILDKVSNA
jgi:hypothetical protein